MGRSTNRVCQGKSAHVNSRLSRSKVRHRLLSIIDQVIKRGDKAISIDVKGDLTQAYVGQEGVDLSWRLG